MKTDEWMMKMQLSNVGPGTGKKNAMADAR